MTRTEILAALSGIELRLATRITIVRVIVDATGKEVGRLNRGFFTAPPGSRISEPQHQEGT